MKVILLGDSIRLGYDAAVKSRLAGEAEVWSPAENCMHSVHHVFNRQPWYLAQPADVIHFNFGLWDCGRFRQFPDENNLPVATFARNLDLLLRLIREHTRAVPVWATITPVLQARHRKTFCNPGDPFRIAADVEIYNAAATPVLARHGVLVNDLHAFVHAHGAETLICHDGVHYTEAGSRLLGQEVASHIRAASQYSPTT